MRLAELAAVARAEPLRRARTFRAQVGLPPRHAFQLDLRVRRARALLAGGEAPAAVAAACGFAYQSHLHPRVQARRGGYAGTPRRADDRALSPGRSAASSSKT